MKIVGCDFHPRWQQVAVFDLETGEISEWKLSNGDGEAERFYRELEAPALVGVEACGNSQWFLELLERLGHQVRGTRRGMRRTSRDSHSCAKDAHEGTRP
ncbi:MAG TPA: hypothetical protein VMV57_15110 [Terracidiphilus sp.]|nr:hypothetical protein [Terracidiphilus sp.]